MSRLTSQIALCVWILLSYWGCVFGFNSGAGQPKLRCLQAEREVLLNIKEDIKGYQRETVKQNLAAEEFKNVVFSSWGNEEEKRECCDWLGIQCANNSGHVISLDLSPRTMGYDEYGGDSLYGRIPFTFGKLTSIVALHLGENNLNEELPSSLKNCSKLRVLDMGENKLLGPIPTWIGDNLSDLSIFILRSNNFHGNIPSSLCHLSRLQLLDLSSNNVSGRIPECFGNFTSMKEIEPPDTANYITYTSRYVLTLASDGWFLDEVKFMWKGTPRIYRSTLRLVKNIDLSSNKLMGEIPEEITQLIGLVTLNLSRNNLSGQIPFRIGRLESLDALDLSNNKFSGVIPLSLSEVHRLSTLDLSSNNLSGKIPTGTQLQSFEATCYMRNPELCGAPLAKCQGEEHETFVPNKESTDEGGQDGLITKGFYVSATLGFVTAFWGVCGSVLLIKSWRHAYFKLLNDVQDWVYVMVAVNRAKLLRLIRN